MSLKKKAVYDALHKSSVTVLMGITAIGAGYLTYRIVDHFIFKKYFNKFPQRFEINDGMKRD